MLIQTVVTVSYLPFVSVLINSIRAHNNGVKFSVLVTDLTKESLGKVRERFGHDIEFLCCDDLQLESLSSMRKYYSVLEFNSACKVLAIAYQLKDKQQKECLFLDPDMYAVGDVLERLAYCQQDIFITSHAMAPCPEDGMLPMDVEFVMSGHINGGVVYFKKSTASMEALDWLIKHIPFYWFVAPQYGLYADQHWLSFFPYYFNAATHVSRDPGLNVGYFNLHERRLSEDGNTIMVNGRPGALFHFSGFSVPSLGRLTRHTNRKFDKVTEGVLKKLISEYEGAFLKEQQKLQDLKGELLFCEDSLEERMLVAERVSGNQYTQLYSSDGFWKNRFGKLKKFAKYFLKRERNI